MRFNDFVKRGLFITILLFFSVLYGFKTSISGSGEWCPDANTCVGVDGSNNMTLVDSVTGSIKLSEAANIFNNDGSVTDFKTFQQVMSATGSGGVYTGLALTDHGDGTVSVAAGEGISRLGALKTSNMKSFVIAATGPTALTDNSKNYIYLKYNSGPDTLTTEITTDILNVIAPQNYAAFYIYRTGNDLDIIDLRQFSLDAPRQLGLKSFFTERFAHTIGGTVTTDKTNMQFAITAGSYWILNTQVPHSAFDSSVADTFEYVYSDGGSSWTRVAAQTYIDYLKYDDGDGTLGNIAVGKWGVHWVFIKLNLASTRRVVVVYGTSSYASLAEAAAAPLPTSLPDDLQFESTGVSVARIVTKQSATTAFEQIDLLFLDPAKAGVPVDHNSLGSLDLAASGKTWGHIDDQTQTIAGTKTFSGAKTVWAGDLELENTTFANQDGIIYKNTAPFIHNFNYGNNGTVTTIGNNTCIGINACNLSMGSTATSTSEASYNTVTGVNAGNAITLGSNNSFFGYNSGLVNTTGNFNSFFGYYSGLDNTTGSYNSFFGYFAGSNNLGGNFNTFVGLNSGLTNTSGASNTFVGLGSGSNNIGGSNNISVGHNSAKFIANGSTANTTPQNSVFVGKDTKALTATDTNQIVIGYDTIGIGSNSANIGNTSITKTQLNGNVGIGTSDPNTKIDIQGGQTIKITTVNAATYDLLVTDYVLHCTYTATAAITSLTLPSAQTVAGRIIEIKDAGGNAGTNNITIDTEGSEEIDGSATYVINSNYGAVKLYSDGTNWFVM